MFEGYVLIMFLDGDFCIYGSIDCWLYGGEKRKHTEIMFNNIFNKLSSCVYLSMCLYQWHISIIISLLK